MKRFIKYLLFCSTLFTGLVFTQNAQASFQEKTILDDSGEVLLVQSKTGALITATDWLIIVIEKDGLEIRVLDPNGNEMMTEVTDQSVHELFLTSLPSGEYVIEMKTTGYFKEFLIQL